MKRFQRRMDDPPGLQFPCAGGLEGGCVSAQAQIQPPVAAAPLPASVLQQPTEALEQLVAPIALYPDALVAQILAAMRPTLRKSWKKTGGCNSVRI